MTTNAIATDSGHWYAKDGSPMYEIKGANGNIRPTTLRDARKLGLLPSVTEIIKVAAKPMLTNWMVEQALDAVLTLPRREGETDTEFKARARQDSQEQARVARERGSALHTSIERYLLCKPYDPEHGPHIAKIEAALGERGIVLQNGLSEKSFASPLGYGGKVDWHDAGTVMDFKTKARLPNDKRLAWDEQAQQLHAYAHGLGLEKPRKLNVFVGLDDCRVEIVEHPDDETPWEQFKCLLRYWQLSKGYDSSFGHQEAA